MLGSRDGFNQYKSLTPSTLTKGDFSRTPEKIERKSRELRLKTESVRDNVTSAGIVANFGPMLLTVAETRLSGGGRDRQACHNALILGKNDGNPLNDGPSC